MTGEIAVLPEHLSVVVHLFRQMKILHVGIRARMVPFFLCLLVVIPEFDVICVVLYVCPTHRRDADTTR